MERCGDHDNQPEKGEIMEEIMLEIICKAHGRDSVISLIKPDH